MFQGSRMMRLVLVFFVLCVVCSSSKPTERKNRVHHEEPLSELEHNDDKNFDYDHEAFLGRDEAKTFDQLPPEESKRRLGLVILTFVRFLCMMKRRDSPFSNADSNVMLK